MGILPRSPQYRELGFLCLFVPENNALLAHSC